MKMSLTKSKAVPLFDGRDPTRLIWCTDIHLNHALDAQKNEFIDAIKREEPNYLLLTGDISEGNYTINILQELRSKIQRPIFFVLGNHDYYYRSIVTQQHDVTEFCANKDVKYLPSFGVKRLNDDTALVGVDGWGDCREGDARHSRVGLNDWPLIGELSLLSRHQYIDKLMELGEEQGKLLDHYLSLAIQYHKNVIVLTHVPPFLQSSLHEGKPSDSEWAPFFVCKSTGDVLLKYATAYPDRNFKVLCGHVHGKSEYQPLPNLSVSAGDARYKFPKINGIFEV